MDKKKTHFIGTKIRFIAHKGMCWSARMDDGKVGKIISKTSYNVRIFLPDSVKGRNRGFWNTEWKNIEPLLRKNQQLLFSFMD